MKITKESKVCILAHVLTTVPAEDLKEYLLQKKVSLLAFIGHPLIYKEGRPGSFFKIYTKGKETKYLQHKNIKCRSIFSYVKDFILSLYWIIKTGKKWDVVVALDNLNALTAIVLKRLGYADKVVYYTIDYVPVRFKNKILNSIYHRIDEYCVSASDLTWNVSPRIIEGRNKKEKDFNDKQITVPIGVWLKKIQKMNNEKREGNSLVYAGGLSKHQGIQLVIKSLKKVLIKVPGVKLYIIGLGDYEQKLKNLVKRLKLKNSVIFLGYFEKHEEVVKFLSQCTVGLAMYSKKNSRWSYYADPSKIKSYLASGLPVITTNLTHISDDIIKYRCGLISKYNSKDLSRALISILHNNSLLKEYSQNATSYSKSYDWNHVFDNAFDYLDKDK